jgi:hypothetical protein
MHQKKLNGLGTWRRYKLGQAQFTSWLKQTADRLVSRKQEEPNGGEEGGAAAAQQSCRQKKKAKAAAAAGIPIPINLDPRNEKFVHWSQLEILAQRVADNADPEDVPDSALNILRDVVGLRKKSYNFFTRASKDTDDEKVKQSNASHAHIISVLERVLAKLEVLVMARGNRERKNESKENAPINISGLSNMFSYLEVQASQDTVDGPSDSEETLVEARRPPQKTRKKKGGAKKLQKPKNVERRLEKASTKTKNGSSWIDEIDFGLADDDEDEDEFDLYMMI